MMPASAADATPSRGEVLRVALPLILSNLSVPLLGMVDTAVVGHMGGVPPLGAVAVASSVFSALFLGLNFLRMATTGLASQAWGGGDDARLRVVLLQGLLVALACAALLLLAQWPLRELSLTLLGPGPEVVAAARLYFDVRVWSAPLVLANYVLVGWLVGLARTRAVLALTLAINLSNLLLDLLLVYGAGMGVGGVALATLLAEAAGLATGSVAVRGVLRGRGSRHRAPGAVRGGCGAARDDAAAVAVPGLFSRPALRAAADAAGLRALFSLNANLLVRTLALQVALLALTARGARLGEVILAANAILLTFQHLISYGLDGFAHAAEALVGRALGARRRDALDAAVRFSFEWALVVAVVAALGLAFGGGRLSAVLTDLPDVRDATLRYLPWVVVSPLVSLWSFVYDGVFVGATAARPMRDVMLIATFLVYLPALVLLAGFGNHGLWAAFTLFMLARGLGMHASYARAVRGRLADERALAP